jgi:hypothetical protein
MVGEVFAGVGALKTAWDIAKNLKDISDATQRNAVAIELQEKILTAQQAQSELLAQISQLEKELAALKDWKADRERYQLVELGPGVVAFRVRDDRRNGEPLHYICADCAAQERKAYLQRQLTGPDLERYRCGACNLEINLNRGNPYNRTADPYGPI